MKMISPLLYFTLFFSTLTASMMESYIVVGPPSYNPGLFSVLNTVIGCLDLYEKEEYGGIEIDFGMGGLYFDRKYGQNWWNYYLEPLSIGSKIGKKIVPYRFSNCAERARHTEFRLSKERVNELISRYFHFKIDILQKVDDFIRDNFSHHRVIGVHYRGTDKHSESPRVEYARVLREIQKELKDDDLVFLATDEEGFLNFLRTSLPERVLSIQATRSNNGKPIHYGKKNNSGYNLGLEAILDAILLSKCNYLIRTSSNLSLFSTHLNTTLPAIELNQRIKNRY